MSQIIRTSVLTIGTNKNKPRLWIEGKYLKKAGFQKGLYYQVNYNEDEIRISLEDLFGRKITEKKSIPVIDINNNKLRTIFKSLDKVKIIVELGKIIIRKTKIQMRISSALNDYSAISLFSGGGLLDKSAELSGFKIKAAVEVDQKYADIWQQNHEGTMHNCDIVEVEDLPKVHAVFAGIPCQPFSFARQNQKGKFHDNSDLSMFALMVIEKTNPRLVILEEVPYYLKSDVGKATIQALERMGYNVQTKIYSGLDFGELEIRKRAVIVASYDKFTLPEPEPKERTMADIIDNDDPDCEWFSRKEKAWFFKRWDMAKEQGKFFFSQIITPDSKSIQAITRRYFNLQAGNPVIQHPTKDGYYRLLTIKERKKLANLPENYYLGPKTTAGEIMGQGIIVNVFHKIIKGVCK